MQIYMYLYTDILVLFCIEDPEHSVPLILIQNCIYYIFYLSIFIYIYLYIRVQELYLPTSLLPAVLQSMDFFDRILSVYPGCIPYKLHAKVSQGLFAVYLMLHFQETGSH